VPRNTSNVAAPAIRKIEAKPSHSCSSLETGFSPDAHSRPVVHQKEMTRRASSSVQTPSALPRFVPWQAPPRSLVVASRSRRTRQVTAISCQLAPDPQNAEIGIRWPCMPPLRLAPPLRRPKHHICGATPLFRGVRSAARYSGARPPTPRMLESAFSGRACHLFVWPPLSDGQNSTFVARPRASGAPAARRANLGRIHPRPYC